MVVATKWLLPALALGLLACIVLWPQLVREADRARIAFRRGALEAESGQVIDPRYHGVDERNRPYTVTAISARQVSPQRIDMVDPKGDVSLAGGSWTMVQAQRGVFMQHVNQLDLSGEVVLYRDDGTTMRTDNASVDLRAGAAASADRVHVEGPFGTIDAQGFALLDQGALVQFSGPGRLVLRGRTK